MALLIYRKYRLVVLPSVPAAWLYYICCRHFNPDEKDCYTFWTYMMGCRSVNTSEDM